MLAMSYDEYLEYFERVRQQRAASAAGGVKSGGPTPTLPASQTVRRTLAPCNGGAEKAGMFCFPFP